MKIKSNRIGYGSRRYQPYRARNKYLNYIGAAAGLAGRMAIGYYGGGAITRSRNRGSSGQGVTSQYDRKVVYRKKYMPRGKKRIWKRFVKKTNAVIARNLGTKTVLFNTQLSSTFADNTQQYVVATLYGADGDTDTSVQCGHKDIAQVMFNDPETTGPNLRTAKVSFQSAVMDITMCNLSTVEAGNNTGSLEIDVYDIQYKKAQDALSLNALITSSETNTPTIAGAGTSITMNTRGATPFEFPDLGSRGVQILKKTKYFLSVGQTATYQMRDPGTYYIQRSEFDDADDNFIRRGMTRSLLILAKGVTTVNPAEVLKSLQVGVTRKYSYKVNQNNVDKDQLL